MNHLILTCILMLTFISTANAGKLVLIDQGNGPFKQSKNFKLKFCQDEACAQGTYGTPAERLQASEEVINKLSKKLITDYYLHQGRALDKKLSRTDLVATLEHLIEDYSYTFGSPAWEEQEIIDLMNFIRRHGKAVSVFNLELVLGHTKGVGIQKDILIFDANTGVATFVPRTTHIQ